MKLPARWVLHALVVLGSGRRQRGARPAPPAPARRPRTSGCGRCTRAIDQALVAGEPSRPAGVDVGQRSQRQSPVRVRADAGGRGAVRAVVRERDRAALAEMPEDTAFRTLMEVFVEYEGGRASARTSIARRGARRGGAPPTKSRHRPPTARRCQAHQLGDIVHRLEHAGRSLGMHQRDQFVFVFRQRFFDFLGV